MSLLEDVFLQDEAGEAQELERIIEGDEYDERPRALSPDSDDNSEKEDEAEEDKRRVDPTSAKPKRVVKNPRVVLNPARLTGPRGIQVIPEHFKDFKFKGKGHEKEDLDIVLKKLEHWAYRLYPKFQFADCLKKIETLGNKRPVTVHLTKIRTDQFMCDGDTVVQRDSTDDEAAPEPVQEEDEFDKLLQQQIDLARATPAPGSTKKPAFSTPLVDKSISMPKATSSPSINDEQRERMLRNKQLAEERRLARLKQNSSATNTTVEEHKQNVTESNTSIDNPIAKPLETSRETDDATAKNISNTEINKVQQVDNEDLADIVDEDEDILKGNKSRSHIIDSSDEDDAHVINESITVDVHDSHRNDDSDEADVARNINFNSDSDKEVIKSNDVEMNDIENENTDSQHNISENGDSTAKPDLEVLSDTKNITNGANEINTHISSDANISEVVSKDDTNVSKTDSIEPFKDKNKSASQSIEETEVDKSSHRQKEVDNELSDIMDVDFSDDF